MRFAVLGAIEARRDGQTLTLGGPKQRALLAFLLLHANEAVSRDRLIDALWGDRPPTRADASLDSYVSRLRKLLGPEQLLRDGSGYVLRVEPDALDLERFERLVSEARFEDALALWRGPALADILYEPFANDAARGLEERRLLALEQRIDADLESGGGAELVPELDRLVREHQLRERLIAQLMLALYRAGRQGDALAAMQSARHRLSSELGLEPGPALVKLEGRILRHDPALGRASGRRAGPRRRDRRFVTAVAAALTIAAVAVVIVLAAAGGRPALDLAGHEDDLVAIAVASARPVSAVGIGATPGAATSGAGSLWVTNPSAEDVVRVDLRSGSVGDHIPVSGEPGDIVGGDGAIWVASTLGATIARIDPATDTITQTIRGANPVALAFADGHLWVADASDHALLELDPSSGSVRRTIRLDVTPSALAFDDGAIWVASYDAGAVEEVARSSGQLLDTVHVGNGPADLAVGGGAVWVANGLDGTVSRIDTQTASVTATIPVGSDPAALAIGAGAVWVANEYSGSVSRIDPRRNAVTAAVAVGGRPASLALASRRLWVGDAALGETHRGGTLRLVTTQRGLSFDPALYTQAFPPESTGLAYDSLVTFERAAGSAGLRLVPDLALQIPAPSDGGRVYVFHLRPGIRYSDGRVVRAGDFRRAFERDLRVRSPADAFLSEIVGARDCLRRSRGCSLSHGVRTDDRTGTITITLAAPDPEFLFELTEYAFAAPVPPGTSDRPVTTDPVPGTGPYRIAAVGPNRIVFERNPFFREWSHAAQPAGNPDRIVLGYSRSHAATVQSIVDGRADWSFDLIPPAALRRLERTHAALLHSNPALFVEFIPLNTQTPPFDDVRVRRALNLALDRRRIVQMYGGPTVAIPACQPLTPGMPGYRRYCPYTRDARPDGAWRAPDLSRARRLVAQSGTRGERVDVWGSRDEIATPRREPAYVAGVLRSLGYRTHLHLAPVRHITTAVRRRLQLSVDGDWSAEYPDPSSYVPQFFGCAGGLTNGYYCNPRLDGEMHRASELELSSPARADATWTDVDHRLTDQAVWAPTVDLRDVELVSPRLRNYQYNPVWGFLADQVWLRRAALQGGCKDPSRGRGDRRGMAKRVVIALVLVLVMSIGAGSAAARTLHVCRHGCAYRQVAGAAAAAHDGDSVKVAPGTYRGGFAITRSVVVDAAGAGRTTIKGGGPVITVGTRDGSTEPTVTIRGVTITGGTTHSAFGGNVEALGGGVDVPEAARRAAPTTLTIVDSAITGNVAAPTKAVDAGMPCGPGSECQFAHAGGGGIDSWGHLTVRDSRVADNQASGPLTSDANGGGIYSQDGTLTVDHSVITGNRALAGMPNGRFAEGAGIMVDNFFSGKGTCVAPRPACRFVLHDSVVAGNLSRLVSRLPLFASDGNFVLLANGGGVHVGDNIPTTVQRSSISHNAAISSDRKGEAGSIDAGILVGASPLTMRDSKVNRNLTATTALTVADVAPVGSAFEVDGSGTIADTSIVGNIATTYSPGGAASTDGAFSVFDTDLLTVKDSRISRNLTVARSDTGSASVLGGGVFNNTQLALDHVVVSHNVAGAAGPAGATQGGGIFNGNIVTGPPTLSLASSRIVRNKLQASPGIPRQGAGLFTTFPVVQTNTVIAGNQPDQCVGCSLVAPMARRGAMGSTQREHAGALRATH